MASSPWTLIKTFHDILSLAVLNVQLFIFNIFFLIIHMLLIVHKFFGIQKIALHFYRPWLVRIKKPQQFGAINIYEDLSNKKLRTKSIQTCMESLKIKQIN